MTKRLFALLRYTTAVALVASIFVLSGCDDDDGPTIFDGTMYDYLISDQFKQANTGSPDNSYDSIVMYIEKFPDLKAYLQGSTEYTFFAPSNKAFVSLTALPGLKDPDQVNPDIIKGVLTYHFVAGKKMQSDLTAGASINTLYTDPGAPSAPQVIKVNTDGTLLTGSSTTNIVVSEYDKQAKNGVVHTTATVLIPPTTGGQLAAILGSLASTVLLGKDFTYMAYMIGYADAGVAAAETYTGILAKGTNLTLLAIPNPVFIGVYNAFNAKPATNVPTAAEVKTFITTTFPAAAARSILRSHVLNGKYVVTASSGSTTFANGNLNSMSGKVLTVTTGVPAGTCQCPTGIVISATKTGGVSQAPIVKPDISTQVGISNGILQVVGGIFLP
ncbi:MAG TPA: fasciclin domain-containing protein [Cyclobacteriaceae bacterium]|nr:fasciclin domain-containing protein [Cyclobacteriaceae bacterium]